MISALLHRLGLTPQQIALIVKVFKTSFALCIMFVAIAWIIQTAGIKKKSTPGMPGMPGMHAASPTSPATEMQMYFEKKSKDLLPIDIDAHQFIAEYYLKNDQPQKAINHILRILPVRKTDRSLFVQLATAYLQSGQYQCALEEFAKLEEGDTSDDTAAVVTARKGLTLFYLGRIRESVDQLEKCVKQFPRSAEAMCYRGELEAATADEAGAIESYFKKSLAIDSNYVEAWYQLARFYMNRGDYPRGRSCLLKVLEIEPLNIKTHARLGMAYYYLNEPELAKKSYQTALTLNPDDYNTHYNLGELYFTKYEDNASALVEFKKALTGNPSHGEAHFRIGVICLGNNMTKEAIDHLEKARVASPTNIRILLQLGVAYEKLELKDEALRIYQYILDIDALNQVARQKVKLLSYGRR